MRSIEYRRWAPSGSPLEVEFPAELLLELGWAEITGKLYGSRRGREVRITSLQAPWDEEQENVGVFFSRIRGEVFLTEEDLAFVNAQAAELALVVAGSRAGFFVREADGSLQTVRSHEEFPVAEPRELPAPPALPPPDVRPARVLASLRNRKGIAAGFLALAALPIAGLAVLPQRASLAPRSLEVRRAGDQLRISWTPGHNAMLTIDDDGGRIAIPVYSNQSAVTYEPRGAAIEVNLLSVDAANHLRRESTRYTTPTPAR